MRVRNRSVRRLAQELPLIHLDLKIAGRTREEWGRLVREIFESFSRTRPDCKSSWLVPWEDLGPADREVDRLIGEGIAREVVRHLRDHPEEILPPVERGKRNVTQEESCHEV